MKDAAKFIAAKLGIPENGVAVVLKLRAEGATVPFMSRYRKEMTGGMDEVQIGDIQSEFDKFTETEKRRKAILENIEEQGKLTTELRKSIEAAETLSELEDLYLPYKQKRKTKASVAREKGLEPLAIFLLKQDHSDPESIALKYINKDVKNVEEALQGARDIITELISENAVLRSRIRALYQRDAILNSKKSRSKETGSEKYKDYFEFSEPLRRSPSHRVLALFRGENEGFLNVSVDVEEDKAFETVKRVYLKARNKAAQQVEIASEDSFKRLIAPSMESEFRQLAKEKADLEAARVFGENLKQLLLSPPLGQKRIMGIDPGFKTGCKIVCLDAEGNLLHNETIFPHPPQNDSAMAAKKIRSLAEAYKIEAIAIGNGTASRETEEFIKRKTTFPADSEVKVFVVSEAGASVYSASSVAREEFPSYDVTVRGSVSIGRRLADPLAELVKIDPKSIGVGQYQHDINQTLLKKELDSITESCVNAVGVNLNTASKYLLSYVSGLGPALAQNIVDFRKQNGAFHSREELKKVPRLGEKAFEQAAGFLRIKNGSNVLDDSAVHPERYNLVNKMAKDAGCTVNDLLKNESARKSVNPEKYVSADVGLPTLKDILNELAKPGLDPRGAAKLFEFDPRLRKIEDLIPGMIVPAIVTNITNFGCFADVGVKQDGLIHVSQMADRFIRDPNEVVKLHQHVMVKVLEVDIPRKRITLTMKL